MAVVGIGKAELLLKDYKKRGMGLLFELEKQSCC